MFRPALKAPKTKPLDEFYLRLNTSAVLGFGQIDAVKVIGSLEDGMPIQDYQPVCGRPRRAPWEAVQEEGGGSILWLASPTRFTDRS